MRSSRPSLEPSHGATNEFANAIKRVLYNGDHVLVRGLWHVTL